MTNQDHNLLIHLFNKEGKFGPRMIFKEGPRGFADEPTGGGSGSPEVDKGKEKSKLDVNSPNFDNLAFKQEKRGTYTGNLDAAIKDTLTQVDALKDNEKALDTIKADFSTGLKEGVVINGASIAEAVKSFPAIYKEYEAGLTTNNSISWFQSVLTALKCDKVALVYDITDDKTKFKFYGEKGEIKFKNADIKIQYIPKEELGKSAEKNVESSEEGKKFDITKKAFDKKNSVDHVKLIQDNVGGRTPVEGDRVVLKRKGGGEIKATFDEKKKQFIMEGTKTPLWMIVTDTITFYPKAKEKAGAFDTVEVDGTQLVVLKQINTKSSYLQVAESILRWSGDGAKLDDKVILDPETSASIVRTGITTPEYAALLKAAHEKIGKDNSLPIIMPNSNLERKNAIRIQKEIVDAEQTATDMAKETSEALEKQLKGGLDVAKNFLNAQQQREVSALVSKYEAKLAKEKNPTKKADLIQDLLDSLDNYFIEAGFSRKISSKLEKTMDTGKTGDSWKELWNKENPTVNKVYSVIEANPKVFGKVDRKTIPGTIYDLIRAGNSSSFDSGDIIKFFKVKLPLKSGEYDEVLGLAAAPAATSPELKQKQDECIDFVKAIEGLNLAIAGLDPSQNKEANASARGHEKLEKNAENGAKNLKSLIDLLNVSSSTTITKQKDGAWVSTIEKGGKRVTLRLANSGTGQNISVHDAETGKMIWTEFDNFGFDAPDYVDKINATIASAEKSKSAEKSEETLESIELTKAVFYSLRSLESLSQGVPGVPVKELLEVKKEKGAQLIDNKLGVKAKELLGILGVLDTAKFVDTPANLKSLKDNGDVLINLRYKGKDFTLHINNALVGWGVRMAPGFNNPSAASGDTAYTTAGGMNAKEVVSGVDKVINSKGYGNAERMIVTGNLDRVTIQQKIFDDFNNNLKAYTSNPASNYPHDLTLNVSQTMEALFKTYSFDELKEMGCIRKVSNMEKAYTVYSLPEKFTNIGQDLNLLKLVYSIKYGKNLSAQNREVMTTSGDTARESVSEQAKYEKRLKKLFAVGLTDFDSTGKKTTMTDVDSGAVTDYSKDEYFKHVSGDAAYGDFYDQVRTRNEKGVEQIDIAKTNSKLNELYKAGLDRLSILAKSDKAYSELNKQVTDAVRTKTIDLNAGLTDLDQKIIRLGYIHIVEYREKEQNKGLEQFKEKLVENILKLLPDKIEDPKNPGQFITKEQAAASLRTLPVSILVTYSHNRDGSNTVGGYLPITLDVFGSDYAKLVILPGVNNTEGLKLAVGVSFTSKDPNDKDQNVIFMGGVTVGLGTDFTGATFGAGIGGGVDFRIVKASEISNYNHYLGLRTGVGMDITNGQFGFNIGAAYTWEIDAKQKYSNSLKEYFKKEGIQGYINELKDIYAKGSSPASIDAFAAKMKADPSMVKNLDIKADSTTEQILSNFELYVAGLMNKFNEDFDLPVIVGGQIGFGVVDGAIIAIGAGTGNVPMLLGGVASWAGQVLASLKFNIGSKMVVDRKQKTSEQEMGAYGDKQKQDQFDKAFEGLPKSQKAVELYRSGRNTLNAKGEKQTSVVDIISSESQVPANNLGKKLDDFNKTLVAQGIDMKLKKGADNRIELVLLDTKVPANENILISKGLVVKEGNKLFLKDPNALTFLYFNKQTRKYPLETSHGATMETVVTISDNRFHKGGTFPVETSITRFADAKENPTVFGVDGKAESYVDNSIDFTDIAQSQGRMKKALEGGTRIEDEKVRPDIKALAKKISLYTSKGENFLSITNEKAKTNKDTPDYISTKLYAFYDRFAGDKKIPAFNASEKALLTLELSALRYTNLMAGAANPGERAARFRERLNWAKDILTPYFEKRLTELGDKLPLKKGETIKSRAKVLVDKAIADLQYLDTAMPTTKLKEGTSVAVAIGRQGNGLHQMLDGSRDKLQTNEVDEYGYVIGKDYTEAMRTGVPADDHDIALILMGQLSALPDSGKDLKGFMDSNLARKLASNGGLAFMLGKADYSKVTDFYEKGTGTAADLTKFIEIVKQIREAEETGKELITVKGDKGVSFLIKVNPRIQTGVFQKCGNYTAAINEEISIIPPSQEEAMALMSSGSESITSITTQAYKQFIGLTGGVVATVSLEDSPALPPTPPKTPPKGEAPKAPPEGKVEVGAAPAPKDQTPTGGSDAKQVTPGPSNDSP